MSKVKAHPAPPSPARRGKPGLALFLPLLTGLVTLGVEMTLGRLISPFLGATIYTWGAIITSIILCLAMGSFVGGELTGKFTNPKGLLVKLLLASGAYQLLVPLFGPAALDLIAGKVHLYGQDYAVNFLVMFGVAVLLAAPSLVPLSAATPVLMALLGPTEPNPARLAGRLMGLGTLGSCLGVVLALFIGIPMLGTKATLWLFALLTFGGLFLLAAPGPAVAALTVGFLPGLLIRAPLKTSVTHAPEAHLITSVETPYTFAQVFESGGFRYLGIEDSFISYSKFHLGTNYTHSYWDTALIAPFARLKADPRRVLILGYGAGVSYQQFRKHYPAAHVESVEIDPAFIPISKEYFRAEPIEEDIHTGDARPMLRALKGPYDVIMLDVYHQSTIPFHLLTRECFEQIRAIASKDAILAFNFAFPGEKEKFLNPVLAALQLSFPYIQKVQIEDFTNIIVIASPQPLPVEGANQRAQDFFSQWPLQVRAYLVSLAEKVASSKPASKLKTEPFTDDKAPSEIVGTQALAWHVEKREALTRQTQEAGGKP